MRRTLSALAMLGTITLYNGGTSAGSGGAADCPGCTNFVAPSLEAICTNLGMATCSSLDELATVLSPQIAEIAALTNVNPGSVRASFLRTNNFNPPPVFKIKPPDNAVGAVNRPELDHLDLCSERSILSRLTPIAFITDFFITGAGATLLDNPAANSFFYAVTTEEGDWEDRGVREHRVRPERLDLFFDYLLQTHATFNQESGYWRHHASAGRAGKGWPGAVGDDDIEDQCGLLWRT